MPPFYSGCCAGGHSHMPIGQWGAGPHQGMWPAFSGCLWVTPYPVYPHCGCVDAGSGAVRYPSCMALPKELEANPAAPSAEIIAGGTADVHISLEYMRGDGAETPAVKLVVSSAGSSFTWEDTAVADGYHVKSDFSKVSPGSKIVISVQNAIARARWFETLASGMPG